MQSSTLCAFFFFIWLLPTYFNLQIFTVFLLLPSNLHCCLFDCYSGFLFYLLTIICLFYLVYTSSWCFYSFLLCNIGVQQATLKWSLISLEQDQLFINMLKCFTVCCIHLYKLILAIRPIWTMCIVQALAIGQIRGPMGGGLCKYF